MAQRWCILNKLNIQMVFTYFSQQNVPLAGAQCSHYLNALCLCLHARYFLVHKMLCVDQRMLSMVLNLERESPVGMILANTLNGLDAIRRRKQLSLQGALSSFRYNS